MPRPVDHPIQIDNRLEAVLNSSDEMSGQDVFLMCHPHPLHQGSMHNKVVTTLCRMARDLGMPSLRFNFRGVGESAGEWDQGIGEIDDALAAAGELLRRYPGARLWLGGFSFGGYVAAHAAKTLKPAGLMLIAPATSRFDMDSIQLEGPALVAFNRDDDTVEPASMQAFLDRQVCDSYVQDQGGHFYHGQLTSLKSAVQQWLEEQR